MPHPSPLIENGLALIQQPISSTDNSHLCICNFALEDTGALGAQTMADDFQANWNLNIAPLLASSATSEKPTCLLGVGTRIGEVAVASGASAAGADAGAFGPSPISLLVKKVTALSGKTNRGRAYIPYAVAEVSVGIDGRINPATVATWQGAMNAFLAGLIAAPAPIVIANKVLVANPSPPPAKYVDRINLGNRVHSLIVEPVVATQRRRLVRL